MNDPVPSQPDDREALDRFGMVRMAEEECWRFLSDHHLGRVAVIQFDRPIIYPVHYAVDGQSIVFRTAPGTKLTTAALGRPAAFEVDEATDQFETGTSVIVHGFLREVTDTAERNRVDRLPLRAWAPGRRDHVVRVEPGWVSGRHIPPGASPDGLDADAG